MAFGLLPGKTARECASIAVLAMISVDRPPWKRSLFYFAAAVPAVGFVHGPADVNPLNKAMLESDAEGWFMNHGPTSTPFEPGARNRRPTG
jgi:hypothetical protein